MQTLSDISTRAPEGLKRSEAQAQTQEWVRRIGEMQKVLHAQQKYAMLVVLQGMDSSGKDAAAANVFKECPPTGIQSYSFKKPTDEEFAHDFLWRVHRHAPAKGMIQLFIRSHYEDVLIQRVHKWITEERARKRLASINAFEELLAYDNNTLVLKFYLHISFEEQEKQLRQRMEEADKHWKHNDNDWKEREYWSEYMRCYEDAIHQSVIPWHIVPVDQRWYRDYFIAKVVCEEMSKLDLAYPPLETRY
jgi:PPK2 family polyphosphate:nucleotide phosphotransferase